MTKINRLTNAIFQHKELWWLLSSVVLCAAGLLSLVTTAFLWYL